jgi:hypothetical protein
LGGGKREWNFPQLFKIYKGEKYENKNESKYKVATANQNGSAYYDLCKR